MSGLHPFRDPAPQRPACAACDATDGVVFVRLGARPLCGRCSGLHERADDTPPGASSVHLALAVGLVIGLALGAWVGLFAGAGGGS